jgi:hypothetical protein
MQVDLNHDPLVSLMQRFGIPLTRENYLERLIDR